MTLEARVGERTRIARELHDTLLQSFHGLLLRFQTARTCCRIARPRRKRTWMVRLITRRARSPKAATRCRDCERRRSNVTISPWRSEPLARSSRLSRAPIRRPPSVSQSRVRRAIFYPIVRDEIYKIAAEAGTRSAMRMRRRWRSRFATTTSTSDCACATMARGSIRRALANQGLGGTLRSARHDGTRRGDRRETGGVERSGRWDGGGAAPSCEDRLPHLAGALLVVAAVALEDAGALNL